MAGILSEAGQDSANGGGSKPGDDNKNPNNPPDGGNMNLKVIDGGLKLPGGVGPAQ